VEKTHVIGIQTILYALKPIAIRKALDNGIMVALTCQEIKPRQKTRWLGSEIGKDEASQLLGRISEMMDALLELTPRRLPWNLQHLATGVV